MAKKKEFEHMVSVSSMDKYMKENPAEMKKLMLGDMEIIVKPYISASEFAEIVNTVIVGSFDEDETTHETIYQPYFTGLLRDMQVLEKYTNITLPQNYLARCELISFLKNTNAPSSPEGEDAKYTIDRSVWRWIEDGICNEQTWELDDAIHNGIEYMKQQEQRKAAQSVQYIGHFLRSLKVYAGELTEKLDGVVDALQDEGALTSFLKDLQLSMNADSEDAESSEADDAAVYEDGERVIPMPVRNNG